MAIFALNLADHPVTLQLKSRAMELVTQREYEETYEFEPFGVAILV